MDQAYYDNIYQQQVDQYEQDRRLSRFVNLLQGMAALLAIIIALKVLFRK